MARPTCDVPGCGGSRRRWHRLCDRCFARLPGEIRVGIEEAHHQRRWTDWTALRNRAAAFLAIGTGSVTARPRISPERAFELNARLMGERP